MSIEQVKPKHQFFSIKRFWRHTMAIYTEKRRPFLWFFAIIGMMYCLILLLYLSTSIEYDWSGQAAIYYMGLYVTGFVFSARYFSNFAKKGSALLALMQPVSTFEKWLLAALTTLIVYPIIYTILYSVMTLPVPFLTNITIESEGREQNPWLFLPFMAQQHDYYFTQLPFWLFYQAMCAFTLMASMYFKSLPLLKTFVLAFCLFLFFILMGINIRPEMDVLFKYFGSDHSSAFETSAIFIQTLLANIFFWIVPSLLLWVASFYALKERELL